MKRVLPTMAFFAFLLSAAQASQCMGYAEDQATMTNCTVQAYQTSDTEPNKLIHEIKLRLADDVEAQRFVQAAQRAWIAFWDAECSFATLGATVVAPIQ